MTNPSSPARRDISVLGSTMSYVEAGSGGPTTLFLHGNPTSSYIWRNIIPHVAPNARCIAPDLIGYGQSGKPQIEYRFIDHVRYLDAFLDALDLNEIVLVAQDWGTALAFHFAARRPEAVVGLAFMDFRTPGQGEHLILEENVFIERVIPNGVVRTLSDEEMAAYRAPFPTPASRKPILRFPRELPIAGEPRDVYAMIEQDHAALRTSEYPKLMFCGDPGALISPTEAETYAARLCNGRLIKLGAGAHHLQEDQPDAIGQALSAWIADIAVRDPHRALAS